MFDVFYFGNKPNLFSHEQEAESLECAAKLSRTKFYWFIYGCNDYTNFDFDFRPPPWEEHQIHAWGNKWQPEGDIYFAPKYCKEKIINYHSEVVHRLPNLKAWSVPTNIDSNSVDYTWYPDPGDPPYIYHFPSQWQSASGVTYTVPGATEVKLVDYFTVTATSSNKNWFIPAHIDSNSVDYTWHPNPLDPPYVYHFPSQWQSASGVTYTVPGATEVKLVDYFVVKSLPQPERFGYNFAVSSFDYSWHPNALDPDYCYVFGNQWNPGVIEPTVIYNLNQAKEVKYLDEPVAQAAYDMTHWEVLDDVIDFDYSWRPNPKDPPYIYVFGNQWMPPEIRPALQYRVDGAVEVKYMDEPKARRQGNPELFLTHYECKFDYSWEPDPGSPPYIYVFGNQHWPSEIMPTVKHCVDGATEIKYMDEPIAQLPATEQHWHTLIDLPFEFDRSWCPDPGDPPYIYQFGNQWYPAEVMPTIEYRVPGATEIKYIDTLQAKLLPIMDRWTVPEEIDSTNIDFSWIPHPKDDPYIHHFGSDYQISTGLTYTMPGATEPKFEGEPPKLKIDKTAIVVVDIFFVDRYNTFSNDRYKKLSEKYPGIQKIRYANSMLETIKRCVTRAQTRKFWVISSLNIYDDFDFAWHAEPWQNFMTHVFPSQWNKWSDTFLINKYEFERHSRWAKGIEEFPNLNFVKNQTVQSASDGSNIYYVDHGNETDQLSVLQSRFSKIKTTRFVNNYLDTFKRIMATAETEYVWIISSICNYDAFDFTWHPEAWQSEMIHVFPSGMQRRGDTFYIHVESFKTQMYELEMLDWFNVINYCEDQSVSRLDPPVFYYEADSLVEPVKNTTFNYPYAVFKHSSEGVLPGPNYVYPCLWAAKDRVIEPLTLNKCNSVVPREARGFVQTQIYDYPYIIKDITSLYKTRLQDIIFISYDEPQAETNWKKLSSKFKATRVHGVQGMHNALVAAANQSNTPWFYAVFAKTEVADTFEFNFAPDYFQQPKHYIFHARNLMNQLEYGHMGIVLYNANIVKNQKEFGIDYTMSAPHAVVPELSAIASFNSNPYHTWRTAFRESAKLSQFIDEQENIENEYRLEVWLSQAQGLYSEWCLRGARDGYEFYCSNKTKPAVLQQVFDWNWLQKYFESIYYNINDPDLKVLEQRQVTWQHAKHY